MIDFLKKYSLSFIIFCIILYCYRSVFFYPITSAGDLPYYWSTYIGELGIPNLWNPHWPTGLGGNQAMILPLKLYLQLPIFLFVNSLHLPWELIERIFLFFMFLSLSVVSSYKLSKSWIGSLIYTTNTWIIMVFSGGQMGVALAYAISPFVLLSFQKFIVADRLVRPALICGIIFSILVLFDVRIAYLLFLAMLLYSIVSYTSKLKNIFYGLFIIIFITFLLNIFWILPLVFTGRSSIEALSSLNNTLASVKFFSFATFSNTLGLLHPNWPENIFGKTTFMKPQFLILPFISFGALFFINEKTKNKKEILFFTLLGLLSAFLAKGANDPFGGVYLWLFQYIPGFDLFRDSTKFYILIAISYTVLIPYTLVRFSDWLSSFSKKKLIYLQFVSIIFVLYWLILIRPLLINQISGIFKQRPVPQEYQQLTSFLNTQSDFSRTLWIPQQQRFGFFSSNHPLLNGQDIFPDATTKKMINRLKQTHTEALLQDLSVKYVVLPYDSEGEIFINDRKYSETVYMQTKKSLENIPWLKEKTHFGKIIVFEVPVSKNHFWIAKTKGSTATVAQITKVSDSQYEVLVTNTQKGDRLIFSEKYDKGWIAGTDNERIESINYKKFLNSYLLSKPGSYDITVRFEPEKWLRIGLGISLLSFIGIILFLGRGKS